MDAVVVVGNFPGNFERMVKDSVRPDGSMRDRDVQTDSRVTDVSDWGCVCIRICPFAPNLDRRGGGWEFYAWTERSQIKSSGMREVVGPVNRDMNGVINDYSPAKSDRLKHTQIPAHEKVG